MKSSAVVGVVAFGIVVSAVAQNITIDSIGGNGTMSFWGAQEGTTATVEWAASLTDAGRTNWHGLTNVVVTHNNMTTDIPMFFRVRGTPATNLVNGLVAYYPFNGNANDESGNDNHGSVNGAVLTTDRLGSPDSAYYFTNAYITCGNDASLDPASNFTISLRFLSEGWFVGWNQVVGFLSKRDNYDSAPDWSLGFHNEWDYIAFWPYGAGSGVKYGGAVALDVWHMVTVVRSNDTVSIYFDGDHHSSIELPVGFTMNKGDTLRMGRLGGDSSANFVGKLDDVRIYNRALTSTEVQHLFTMPY